MTWSWFDGGWEPSTLFHLLQKTAISHDALIKPAPTLLIVLFVQDSVSAGVWEHVSGSEGIVPGFLAAVLVLMTGCVLTGYVLMWTGHLHVIRMMTPEETLADL